VQCLHYAAPCVFSFSLQCCKYCEVGRPCGRYQCNANTILTTPSAPSKVASQHFPDGAATPPLGGGDYDSYFNFSSSSYFNCSSCT
jgi:hypothetical protein